MAIVDAHHTRTMRVLAASAFGGTLSIRVCDPMLPSLGETFGRAPTDVSLVVTVFVIAYGLFSLVAGPLGDRRGKIAVISVSALVAAGASLAAALPLGYGWLVAMRFVAGAAIGAVLPLSLAWVGDTVAYAERATTLARFTAAATSGGVAGQAIGGIFADTLGWHSAFLLPGLLFLSTGLMLRGPARREALQQLNVRGQADSASALSAYRAILRDPRARFLMLAVLLEGALCFGAIAFIPSFLHLRYQVPLWQAGLVVGGFGIGGLVFAYFSRPLIRRLGEVGLVIAGGSCLSAGLIGVVLSPAWAGAVAACLLTGFGFYMMHNSIQARGTQLSPSARGTGLACMALAMFAGQSIGVAGASRAIALTSYGTTLLALGLLSGALGMLIMLWLRRHPPIMD